MEKALDILEPWQPKDEKDPNTMLSIMPSQLVSN